MASLTASRYWGLLLPWLVTKLLISCIVVIAEVVAFRISNLKERGPNPTCSQCYSIGYRWDLVFDSD